MYLCLAVGGLGFLLTLYELEEQEMQSSKYGSGRKPILQVIIIIIIKRRSGINPIPPTVIDRD